ALGLTERIVRSIRTDKQYEPFLGPPLWIPSEWEREWARQFSITRRARGLLTPEFLAKNEVTERDGHLTVLDDLDHVSLTSEQYRKAKEFREHCYALGMGDTVLTRWGDYEPQPWEDLRDLSMPPVLSKSRKEAGLTLEPGSPKGKGALSKEWVGLIKPQV